MTVQSSVEELPLAVESMGLHPDDAILEREAHRGMPHLGQFLDYIAVLQSGEEESYGRRYQRETIQRGELRLPSPFTGEFVTSTRSYLVSGRVFYWFPDSPDFYVAASRINHGLPLSAIFIPAANRMLSWEPQVPRALGIRHLQELTAQLPRKELQSDSDGVTRVIVVAGNRNFAHHLWNELTAFEQLVSQSIPLPTRELMIAHEPLGRIDRIFPEIAHWKIHRVPFASMPQALYVNLGGYRISERMRTRMLQHARREVSSDIDSLIQYIKSIAGPVFWISVRTNPPTFENQRELIVAVCRRLLNSNVRCCILLDGFSLPEDWSSTDDATSESYRTLAEASRNEIDAIIGELSHTMRSSSQLLVNAGGIRLLDSIALAQLADAYFCHSGSVQHKIGWTANKPGIIHGPRKALSKAKDPRTWHSERLDEAVPPLPLPRQMIQDVEDDLREKNYRAGGGVVAQFVANYFSYHVRR